MSKQSVIFGAEVRRRREAGRLTQEELAERIGLTRESVGKIERGKTEKPSDMTLAKIEAVLGLSVYHAREILWGPTPLTKNLEAEFDRIAAIEDEEERWQEWDKLPDPVRRALLRYAEDLARVVQQQARAVVEQSDARGQSNGGADG